jgi:D-3-phosphoglycerate dehydrogenase
MKVAVTDYTFESLDAEKAVLEPLGCEVVGPAARDGHDLAELVADADAVITQFARVDAGVIAAMTKARVIARYGIGVDNVDLDAARARGIPVCNVPDYCIDEVADHTLALILNLTRQVIAHRDKVRGGTWGSGAPLKAMRALKELTVGVVGFGRIGRAVVQRLRAFKCPVLVADPFVPSGEAEKAGARSVSLEELLKTADLVTLHCPSTPETRRILNRETLAVLKPGALLVNVGRGDLVETRALIDALREGRVGAAALDVCDPEPVEPGSPLLTMANVIMTPHVASASVPAVAALRESVARTVAKALKGEPLANVVNGVKPV